MDGAVDLGLGPERVRILDQAERPGAAPVRPAGASADTPGAGLARAAAGASGTDKIAGSDTEASEAEPGTAEAEHAEAADRRAESTDPAGDAAEAARADHVTGDGRADAGDARAEGGAESGAEEDGAQESGVEAVRPAGTGGSEDTATGADTGRATDDRAAALDDEVTLVPGVARYHRRGCILIRFLSDGDLETTTRRKAEAARSVPCKACQPDKPDPSA